MIYIILILFLVSLVGITVMLGQKIVLIRSGRLRVHEDQTFEVPYLKEAKEIGIYNAKKLEHKGLVATIRYYVLTTKFLKHRYDKVKTHVKKTHDKHYKNSELKDKVESSKIVKVVSGYKHKIKTIKEKVKEEEKDR